MNFLWVLVFFVMFVYGVTAGTIEPSDDSWADRGSRKRTVTARCHSGPATAAR